METKVGTICLATDQGLGYLAKDFFDNGLINKVYIYPHSSRLNHREWYPGESVVSSPEELLDCDTILFFETPFDWKIIPKAREKGVKTVLMVMYESTPYPLHYQPDVVLSPSLLDQQYYPESTLVTVPVPSWVKWKERSRAEVFVHNAGNGGLGGRNGTKELLEALEWVKSPIKLILRSQIPLKLPNDPRIDYRMGSFDNKTLYEEGDVFIFPEKFNGLSLPLQEAFASGMVIMSTDRFPINEWLPKELLIPVAGYKKERIAVEFDCAQLDPKTIALHIDKWYNQDVTKFSLMGREWGNKNQWLQLSERYKELLSPLSEALGS